MQNPRPHDVAVLVADDDDESRQALSDWLGRAGCRVTSTAHGREALAAAARACFEVAFVNSRLVGRPTEEDLVAVLAASSPDLKVVLLEAEPAEGAASSPLLDRDGWDVLPKPYTSAAVVRALDRALTASGLQTQARDLLQRLDLEGPPALLTSRAPAMRAALEAVGRAARSDAPILLRGSKGVGKKLLAGILHRASLRAERPFLVMSCATSTDQAQIAEELATGGRLSGVTGGTLLLDEIHLLSADLQTRLARSCRGQTADAAAWPGRLDVRILATTSVDLETLVRDRRFRSDLLELVEIQVPALRERTSDIMPLARHFLEFFARACGRPPPRFSSAFEAMLTGYQWPGNVRELRNVVERAALLGEGEVLEPHGFAERVPIVNVAPAFVGGPFTLEAVEQQHILGVIARARTLEEAAEVLGIDISTLWRKRKRYLDDHLRAETAAVLPGGFAPARGREQLVTPALPLPVT